MDMHPDDISELQRLKHKVDTISGPGVTNERDSITIRPPTERPY